MRCSTCQTENPDSAAACTQCAAPLTTPTDFLVTINFSPGALFHNRYVMQGLLGRGGMGVVYKAQDRTLDETVAIKILRPDFAHDPKMADRFKSEIKLARRVRNKNVCSIHDYGEDSGLLYISMEFIEGTDLKHLLRERGAFGPETAFDLAIQVAEGLQAVHDAGIIHRDLKSPNIMLDSRGVARLMDFGIAKRQGEVTLTATGQVVGTPEYMSPEQAQGQRVDFRSDIYSLAVVTYEIFTGRVPFQGETPISTILKHINDPPPLDGGPSQALPRDLKGVLRRALAKNPDERHATATQFAEALRRARSPSLRQEPVPTAVLEAPTVPRIPATRRGNLRGIAVGGIALAGVLAVIALRQRSLSDTAPASPLPTSSPAVSAPAPPSLAPPLAPSGETPAPSSPVAPAPVTPTSKPFRAPAASSRTERAAVEPRSVPSPSTAPAPETVRATPPPVEEHAGTGLLQVGVKPWAEVTIDGTVVGTTPLDRVSLPAGVHIVQLRHPSYEVVERKVDIHQGVTERLVVDFLVIGVRKP